MREVDAEAPVVWPAWCYSGGGGGGGEQTGPGGHVQGGAVAQGGRQRAGRRRAPHGAPNGTHESPNSYNNNNNNTLHGPIKNERLSPQNATDRSSSRSRSVTPSTGSFPGTPPQSGGTASGDRDASPAHSILGNHPPAPPPHALARNYSDFMRSLAAKYNNANSTEFFNPRPMVPNGFNPSTMDQKFGVRTPSFVGLLAPPPGVSLPYRSPPPATGESRERPLAGIFSGYSYAQGGPRTVPAFPSIMDMSSTKALLAIARVANVANAAKEADNYHPPKSAVKRPQEGATVTSPLDLSSSGSKKSRLSVKSDSHHHHHQNESRSSSGSNSPKSESRNGVFVKSESGTTSPISFGRRSPGSSGRKTPGSVDRKSPVGCCRNEGRRDCNNISADPEIATWTVDDVCKFVESIDICAEYSPVFREQRIDGSGLPLLTEEHLTGLLKMKLGPALKMKAALAGRLGSTHCGCRQTTQTPVPVKSPSSPTATSNAENIMFKLERPPSVDLDIDNNS